MLQYKGRGFDNMDVKEMNLTNTHWKEKADISDRQICILFGLSTPTELMLQLI